MYAKLHSPIELFINYFSTTELWLLFIYIGGFLVLFVMLVTFIFIRRRRTIKQFQRMVYDDELTDTKNINYLRKQFNNVIVSFDQDVSMYYINIDNFKNYNDLLGHKLANNILKEIADRLMKLVHPYDTVYRVHSDHFIVLYPSAPDIKEHFSNQLLNALKEPYTASVHTVKLTVSVGRYHIAEKYPRFNECLLRSELALQEAKGKGKDQVVFYSRAIKRKNSEAFSTFRLIKDALKDHNFYLEFQPIINAETLEIIGLESLIRIKNIGRTISPQDIITYAEKYHLIDDIDRYVIRASFEALKRFELAGCTFSFMSINISTQEIRDTTFIDYIVSQAKEIGIDPHSITIEFTETYHPEDFNKEADFVKALQKYGFKVAIDDFGSGYSSMVRLSENKLDKIKIDRSFITGINNHQGNQRIVEAIIALSKTFELDVIVEGIETEEELQYILSQGVKYIQGYYFYHAMSAESIVEMCDKKNKKAAEKST